MPAIDRRLVNNFDWALLSLVGAILIIGIINLISATDGDGGISREVSRQLLATGLGGVALLVALAIDYRHFERFATPIFALTLILLASTLVFAPITRGSRGWLFEGSLQPSEFARVGMILALVGSIAKCRNMGPKNPKSARLGRVPSR